MSPAERAPEGAGVATTASPAMPGAVLEISGLSKRFGGLPAISDVTFSVRGGERRLILGPNGAGKTTFFNLISGDIAADRGTVRICGVDATRLRTAARARLGLARTYQILTLFGGDTLLRNVAMAVLGASPGHFNPLAAFLPSDGFHQRALSYLGLVGLDHLAHQPLGACSYGEKRRLELAMALAQEPRLLLLDEPLAGLSQQERKRVIAVLAAIPRQVSILMIEHDMDSALSFAERISVFQYGRLIVEGTREEVVGDPRTREVYLGH